jgi:hypothetical protein
MEPGHASAAARAIAALHSLATTALPGTQVLDGPIGGNYVGGDVLVIGWSDGFTPSVITSRGDPDLGGRAREDGDIVCVADVYSGDEDPWPVLRGRAESILDDLNAALLESGLTPAVDAAWIGEASEWTQSAAEDGNSVRVAFAVHYVAEL